ncbi:MAG TPA: Do family serine endopeptidase [Verrucomicrobiales bacterium]|nr:Do family serine endopeptidase [Verrucomicrobiales bacterium]
MKKSLHHLFKFTVSTLFGLSFLGLAAQFNLPFLNIFTGSVFAADPPSVIVDSTPLKRELKAATSFAPMLREVSKGVVNIYTITTVNTRSAPGSDEILRYFYGPGYQDRFPTQPRRQQNLGSGVIVTPDGYILTNNHVVNGVDSIRVVIPESKAEFEAKLIGSDPDTEVAILKIEAENLSSVTLGDSSLLEVGDTVLAIGNPFGVGQTVTSGIVSALGRGFGQGISIYEDYIQTDASINPGNSGGALLDVEGRLVGINTAIISNTYGSQGIGLSIPVNLARSIMDQLVTTGKISRGFLGVLPQAVDADLAQIFELPSTSGAIIARVEANTPAEKAGLAVEDIIVEIDGKTVKDDKHLRLIISQKMPGTEVKIKAYRDGKKKDFTVILGELNREDPRRNNGFSHEQEQVGVNALKGLELSDTDSNRAVPFNLPTMEGAVVTEIDPNSPAYDAGLRRGYVILDVDGEKISTAQEAFEAGRTLKSKLLLRVWLSNGNVRLMVIAVEK